MCLLEGQSSASRLPVYYGASTGLADDISKIVRLKIKKSVKTCFTRTYGRIFSITERATLYKSTDLGQQQWRAMVVDVEGGLAAFSLNGGVGEGWR